MTDSEKIQKLRQAIADYLLDKRVDFERVLKETSDRDRAPVVAPGQRWRFEGDLDVDEKPDA